MTLLMTAHIVLDYFAGPLLDAWYVRLWWGWMVGPFDVYWGALYWAHAALGWYGHFCIGLTARNGYFQPVYCQ